MENFDKEIKNGVKTAEKAEHLFELLKTYNSINLALNSALQMINYREVGDISLNSEIYRLSTYKERYYYYYNDSINMLLDNFNKEDYLVLQDAHYPLGKQIIFLIKNNYVLKYELYNNEHLLDAQLLKIGSCKGKIYETKLSGTQDNYYEYCENGKFFGLEDSANIVRNRHSNIKNLITCDGKLNDKLAYYDGKDIHEIIKEQTIYDLHDKMLESRDINVKKLTPKLIKKLYK